MRSWMVAFVAAAVLAPAEAATLPPARSTAPVLTSEPARDWASAPLFQAEVERARRDVEVSIAAGVIVPVPKDSGGGFTHEQHKRNGRTIYQAGLLFRLTGEVRYADHARDLLLAYARLYPTLGRHPAGREQLPGRLFWQTLNDSVFLVNAIQGYDAIRGRLDEPTRKRIDDDVFRRMARFLSDETPANFNLIHNHATWALAGVGMTGYALRDQDLVEKAMSGLDRSGKAGLLRQLDLLFSPDGFYEEGPYYQRYALMPFVLLANAVEMNQPERRIFQYRDGILAKAIHTTVQLTYDTRLFPLNDAIKDKALDTEELVQAIAVGYRLSADPSLLSVAARQGRVALTPDGLRVAQDLAAGKARPFAFRSQRLRDGAEGDQGSLDILRAGSGWRDATLVMKNTAQGQGHGHFDKLAWTFFDNGQEVVTDYGAARFLNVVTKGGGGYLPENDSWAKQTIAHNTLVVDEASHFAGRRKDADRLAPRPLSFVVDGDTQIASARMSEAYSGVSFTRTLALVRHPDLEHPVAIDLLSATADKPRVFDLPLHFAGHITNLGFKPQMNVTTRPVLGQGHGYQHIWVDGVASPAPADAHLTWLLNNRFYSYRFLPNPGAQLILGESGANDPEFNLRREPLVLQRIAGAANATFVGVLEPHGEYNGAAEYTLQPKSRIARIAHAEHPGADVVTLELSTGNRVVLALAKDPDAGRTHVLVLDGRELAWTGPYGRFDR